MVLSISVVLLLTVAVGVVVKTTTCKWWHALVCAAWGFYLAGSPLAPTLNSLARAVFGLMSGRG